MSFLVSLPCQIAVTLLVAVVVGSTCSTAFLPLNSALGDQSPPSGDWFQVPSSMLIAMQYGFLVALGLVLSHFSVRWLRAKRSSLAINRCAKLGTVILEPNFSNSLMRYRYSKVRVDYSRIDFSSVDLRDFPDLSHIHRLTEFRAIETNPPIELIQQLSRCPNLEKVNFTDCTIDDLQMQELSQLKQLRELSL